MRAHLTVLLPSLRGLLPALLLLALAVGSAGCTEAPIGSHPTVVLIVFDAFGASHVGHLGYERETTPNLDAVAREGVSFSRAFAPVPFTVASIPSLLTGRHPFSHGVTGKTQALRPDETTLAEILGRAGYRTFAGCANPNGGKAFGNGQGFEVFSEMWIPSTPDEIDIVDERRKTEYHLASGADLAAFAGEVLAVEGNRPLFLYLHVLEPHTPFLAPDEFRARWTDPAYDGPFAEEGSEDLLRSLEVHGIEVGPADIEHVTALYDANIAWADRNLGAIRRELEKAELWREALVVVTSDHGEACWEHEQWGHNTELYDEFLRVPLVVKLPGTEGPRGAVVEEMVSTLDVLPTVCEALGLALPGGEPLDGLSMGGLLLGTPSARAQPDGKERELTLQTNEKIPALGLRSSTQKTIVRLKRGESPTDIEHYRLDLDPEERENIFEEGGRAVRMRVKSLRKAYASRLDKGAALRVRPQATELEVLEKLGYVGED